MGKFYDVLILKFLGIDPVLLHAMYSKRVGTLVKFTLHFHANHARFIRHLDSGAHFFMVSADRVEAGSSVH